MLRFAREMQGKKQRAVAQAACITQQSVNAYEHGYASLSVDTLKKIAVTIGLNPEYLSDPTVNPFKSDELIKMELPERYINSGIDFEIFYFLATNNKRLRIIFLYSMSTKSKQLLRGTIFGNPVWAIACQDTDGNIFLFKRKKRLMGPVLGDQELRIEIVKYRSANKLILIEDKEIGDKLLTKISDWTITKSDLEGIFSVDDDILLDELDTLVIKTMRNKRIGHRKMLEIIENCDSSILMKDLPEGSDPQE
ncbi:MAG: helix-turn-helix transcriptional regulator [Proteobacteria bacterium]|nr:helix-turn-helix transcriptional regulator [Pseudomonadota bacterium]